MNRFLRRFVKTEQDTHRIAGLFSIALHIVFFLLVVLSFLSASKERIVDKVYRMPVEMVVVEAKKPPPPKPKPKAKSKQLVSKKASTKSKKVKSKPTRLPGDRSYPIVTDLIAPVYPKTALNNEWEGLVKLRVVIDKMGKLKKVSILKSSGHSILDESFMRTVRQYYKFKPKRVQGKNVEATKVVQYSFKL